MKKIVVSLLKISISIALVAFLIWYSTQSGERDNAFKIFMEQPKDWPFFAAAWGMCALGVFLTFIRWWYLIRALDMTCGFSEAFRISFWGFLINMAPLGIVGGDLVKAVMLAQHNKQKRARAVASVMVDRAIGLYILFLVASAAIYLTGFSNVDVPIIHDICHATLLIAVFSTIGVIVIFCPWFDSLFPMDKIHKIPKVGPAIANFIEAIHIYRGKPVVMLNSSIMTVGVHCSFAIGVYFIACGLPGDVHTLANHFVMVPLASATQVIPLSVGPFEGALALLYAKVPDANLHIAAGQGLVVALAYRVIMLLIAALGLPYYFGNRKDVQEAMHDAELPETE